MRILLAEDSDYEAAIYKALLEELGCVVDPASDGITAWQMLLKGGYRALVTDNQMPGMKGFELLQNMHRRGIEIPTLIHSTSNLLHMDFPIEDIGQVFEGVHGHIKSVSETSVARAYLHEFIAEVRISIAGS